MRTKGFTPLLVLIFAAVVAAVGFFFIKNTKNISNDELAIVGYIANFSDLTETDLPNISSYKDIYDYNGHILFVGGDRIVEYDKNEGKLIRVNDPRVLGCVYDSAKLDDYLFVSCNPDSPEGQYGKKIVSGKISKIDLRSGKIVKEYFGEEIPVSVSLTSNDSVYHTIGSRANLEIAIRDNILYMESWDGVEKMDLSTGRVTQYSMPGQVKPGYELDGLNLAHDPMYYLLKPPEVTPPKFGYISPILEGKRYLLGTEGVYSLEEGQFPKKIIDMDKSIEFWALHEYKKVSFSKDGRYLLYMGPVGGIGKDNAVLRDIFNALLVDLKDMRVFNLTEGLSFNTPINYKNSEPFEKLNHGYLEEVEGEFLFKEKDTNNVIFSIDLSNPQVKIMKGFWDNGGV